MPAFDRKTHPREYLFQRCKELIDKINIASNDMVIMLLVKSVVDTRNSRNQITGYILNIRSGFGQRTSSKLHLDRRHGPCWQYRTRDTGCRRHRLLLRSTVQTRQSSGHSPLACSHGGRSCRLKKTRMAMCITCQPDGTPAGHACGRNRDAWLPSGRHPQSRPAFFGHTAGRKLRITDFHPACRCNRSCPARPEQRPDPDPAVSRKGRQTCQLVTHRKSPAAGELVRGSTLSHDTARASPEGAVHASHTG